MEGTRWLPVVCIESTPIQIALNKLVLNVRPEESGADLPQGESISGCINKWIGCSPSNFNNRTASRVTFQLIQTNGYKRYR